MGDTKISGTKEWSVASVNCLTGCSHDCRYCYARANALRFKRIATPAEWSRPVIREKEVNRRRRKVDGTVMFPTTHDILPEFLEPCLTVIRNLLEAGNRVLIVSKPHYECIQSITDEFAAYRERILLRFTMGALSEDVLRYWEPGAPSFKERFHCLVMAHQRGFATSVSCEPLLEPERVVELFPWLEIHVSDTIWIGKLNQASARCVPGTSEEEISRIEAGQTDERVREIYEELKDQPKVRWKESYKRVLGLEEATAAGLDV